MQVSVKKSKKSSPGLNGLSVTSYRSVTLIGTAAAVNIRLFRYLCRMTPFFLVFLQRFILAYVMTTTVISLAIILPINFQGTQYQNATDFGHTTLGNLGRNQLLQYICMYSNRLFIALLILSEVCVIVFT
jgi:hypothetical protein